MVTPDPGSRSGRKCRHVKNNNKVEKEKKNSEVSENPHLISGNLKAEFLRFCSLPCLSALGFFFWLKIFPVCSSFFSFSFFSSNYIPVHVARVEKEPDEQVSAPSQKKSRRLSSRRVDVFGGIPLVCCHAANRQAGLRKPRERYP